MIKLLLKFYQIFLHYSVFYLAIQDYNKDDDQIEKIKILRNNSFCYGSAYLLTTDIGQPWLQANIDDKLLQRYFTLRE